MNLNYCSTKLPIFLWERWNQEEKLEAVLTGWDFFYQSYRFLAWYGESISLPLLFWAPLTIGLFTVLRLLACDNSGLKDIFGDPVCLADQSSNLKKLGVDSIAAFFPIPFSKNHFDTLEHIIGLPILGTAFIALKRRFERTK